MNDVVLESWSSSLPVLQSIELLGPFLVKASAWKTFFQSHPRLKSFLITQSPRFDVECMKTLVETSHESLQRLGLREIGKMSDEFLEHIAQLSGTLTYLDLADPAESCSEGAMITLLSVLGPTLTHLDLSGHITLTDGVLHQGLKSAAQLEGLVLSNLPELTDEGVAKFFSDWEGPPLSLLSMSRNPFLATTALTAVIKHSGASLRDLNINGWKDVEQSTLGTIGNMTELKKLDWGWCRNVDDFIMKDLLTNCKGLQEVKVWGCNKVEGKWVSSDTKTKAKVFGIEYHAVL